MLQKDHDVGRISKLAETLKNIAESTEPKNGNVKLQLKKILLFIEKRARKIVCETMFFINLYVKVPSLSHSKA
jgi:hypothetical protein